MAKKKKSVDGGGLRHNAGKVQLSWIVPEFLRGLARVMMFGATKYAPWNWARGMAWTKCYDCLQRHMTAWYEGEDLDPETGLSHLDHAAANLMMLKHYADHFREGDDRPVEFFKKPGGYQPRKSRKPAKAPPRRK
jgi:hypothetical protein